MDISIIGAGPIGCYAGYLLAQSGHKVTIFENHSHVGVPIQCTGILTSEFDRFNIPVTPFLVNTIHNINVYSPKNQLTVSQKEYIVCRTKFDNHLADLAKSEGATIHVNHNFLRKEGKQIVVKNTALNKEIYLSPDIVIAADGPLSPTTKAFGFYEKSRKNYVGVQAIVEGTFDPHTIKTYFGNEVCPGLFAWVTPESTTTARVGLAMKEKARSQFEKFMKEQGFTASYMQAGTIPVYNPKQKLKHDNCYVIGDASTYVKATTLGGIVPAMQQAEIVVDCIHNNKDIESEMTPIRKQMKVHLHIQKIFEKFSDTDWDRLVGYVGQKKIQNVFEKYTRDNPIPLVMNALLREPRFALFAKYLFK